MSVATEGFPDAAERRATPGYPSEEDLARKGCAVIECVQEIPCNPCETVCPYHAIEVGQPITNLPALSAEACRGCGLCVAACPGQAIFLVDKTYRPGEALVGFPYEYLPLPKVGDTVTAVDRTGKEVGPAKVVRVVLTKQSDRTPVVYLAVPVEATDEVRSMRRLGKEPEGGEGAQR